MARLSDLVTKTSVVLGISEPTVAMHARHLREGGLISKSGRGASAARMSALDAARMLISFLCTDIAKNSAEVVRDFGSLVLLYKADELGEETSKDPIKDKFGAASDDIFERTLANILDAMGGEEHDPYMDGGMLNFCHMEIRFKEFIQTISISCGGIDYFYGPTEEREFIESLVASQDKYIVDEVSRIKSAEELSVKYNRGLRIERSVLSYELKRLADLIADRDDTIWKVFNE
ncbi:hypothetical protein [Azospirillum brasilense]|nr:hypothetical protein [Azospirillum brasilense]